LHHNKKSIPFLVIRGYFVKCGIIISFILLTLVILYTDFFLSGLRYIPPTPKKSLILYKISLSFSCKFISNEILTLDFKDSDISIITEKQPSAFINPVTQIGSSLSLSKFVE
jgi:hypothetical protein